MDGMWKGRYIVFCVLAFIAGDILGGIISFPPAVWLLTAVLLAALCLRHPSLAAFALAFAALGAAGVQIGRMPPAGETPAIRLWASGLKERFSVFLETILPPGDELSILKALAIGDKSEISRSLKADYRTSGAMHLLALSGLHVGIIYGITALALRPLGGSRPARRLRSAVTLAFLWLFAMVSGLSASIFRAVMMITIYELSDHISGERDGLTALAASALIATLLDPESPRDIGFQLSYSAMVAIFVIFPRLRKLLRTRSGLLQRIWDMIAVSISCQATCGLLAWLYFGTFPRYFLLTAIFAVPAATAVMYAVAAALATSWLPAAGLPGTVASSTAALLRALLHALNWIIATIASLP